MTGAGRSYEITVGGHLDDHWSERLGGLRVVRTGDSTTVLTGTLADQAQLHGVLSGLRDLGVELLGLQCAARGPADGERTAGHPVRAEVPHEHGIPTLRSQ